MKRVLYNKVNSLSAFERADGSRVRLAPRDAEGDHVVLTDDEVNLPSVVGLLRSRKATLMSLEESHQFEKARGSAAPKVEAEEPKAEEPKAEEPKAEEPKAEEPKAEEPKAEEPKAEPIVPDAPPEKPEEKPDADAKDDDKSASKSAKGRKKKKSRG